MTITSRRLFSAAAGVIVLGLSLVYMPVANAHILESDNEMTAELHMPPDDLPLAGEPAVLQFTFEPQQDGFSLSQCDCRIEYEVGGSMVGSQQLAPISNLVSRNTFTFPKSGEYTFHVSGSPQNGATFAAFDLHYDKHVGEAAKNNSIPIWAWIGGGVVMAVLLVRAGMSIFRKPRTSKH